MGHGTNPGGALFVAQSTKVANRDAAGMLTLKTRKSGQGALEERGSRAEFREELDRKERKARDERDGKVAEEKTGKREIGRGPVAIQDNPFPEDADEAAPPSDSEKSEQLDDDDDDDTEELMRELAKIKQEREAEEAAKKAEQKKLDERSRREEIMQGNPLVSGGNFSLKRKWDEDTVFKNQARTAPKEKLRFINDAVRSDFHRKFLNKYVWVDGVAH